MHCSVQPSCMPPDRTSPPATLPHSLAAQLHPWAFEEAARGKLALTNRMQEVGS